MIHAVIFDMDGLLIDSEPFWREAEKEVFAKVGIHLTDAMCESVMGLRINEVIAHWRRLYPWDQPGDDVLEEWIIEKVGESLRSRGSLMAGVQEVIEFFLLRRIPMALASASSMRLIEIFLARFDLKKYFQIVHSAEYESYGKPHPAVFLTTAGKLKVSPTQALVFEDSFNGLIAAKAARMKTVVVPAPEAVIRPYWVLADIKLNTLLEWNEEHWQRLTRPASSGTVS